MHFNDNLPGLCIGIRTQWQISYLALAAGRLLDLRYRVRSSEDIGLLSQSKARNMVFGLRSSALVTNVLYG